MELFNNTILKSVDENKIILFGETHTQEIVNNYFYHKDKNQKGNVINIKFNQKFIDLLKQNGDKKICLFGEAILERDEIIDENISIKSAESFGINIKLVNIIVAYEFYRYNEFSDDDILYKLVEKNKNYYIAMKNRICKKYKEECAYIIETINNEPDDLVKWIVSKEYRDSDGNLFQHNTKKIEECIHIIKMMKEKKYIMSGPQKATSDKNEMFKELQTLMNEIRNEYIYNNLVKNINNFDKIILVIGNNHISHFFKLLNTFDNTIYITFISTKWGKRIKTKSNDKDFTGIVHTYKIKRKKLKRKKLKKKKSMIIKRRRTKKRKSRIIKRKKSRRVKRKKSRRTKRKKSRITKRKKSRRPKRKKSRRTKRKKSRRTKRKKSL